MNFLPRFFSKKVCAGIAVGALYGLAIRLGMAGRDPHSIAAAFIAPISIAFFFACPFAVGAIAVLWSAERGARMGFRRQLGIAISAMALFLLGMFGAMVEGLICIILILPVFMVAAAVGGLVGGAVHNLGRVRRGTLPALALLPFLVGPLENLLPPQRSEQVVTNTLHVNAAPEVVFAQLANVRDVRPGELGFSFVHQIGLPRPIEAEMAGGGVGAVRTSRWEKNVWFQEVITEWDSPRALRYRFVVPKGAIPREALDEHVEINGAYFDLIDGGFTLVPGIGGGTELSLSTRFVNKSRMKIYGDLWGTLVLKDFHRSILGLMKSRAEHHG